MKIWRPKSLPTQKWYYVKKKYKLKVNFPGLSSKMCKLIFRRSYDRHIYYLKLNQRVAPHHFYKPHIKVTYHALSGTGNR